MLLFRSRAVHILSNQPKNLSALAQIGLGCPSYLMIHIIKSELSILLVRIWRSFFHLNKLGGPYYWSYDIIKQWRCPCNCPKVMDIGAVHIAILKLDWAVHITGLKQNFAVLSAHDIIKQWSCPCYCSEVGLSIFYHTSLRTCLPRLILDWAVRLIS